MLRAVNWVEKLGQFFNGHHGRVLKILILFLCALGVLVGIYRVRSHRIDKETEESVKNQLRSVAAHAVPVASTTKWVIVANPDDADVGLVVDQDSDRSGNDYVCSTAQVAQVVGWKTIIIGNKLPCCRKPDCFAIHKSQFLRMTYKTAGVIKTLTEDEKYPYAYKETIRNIAFIWAMHRGARYIFDAYVDEYQSAGVSIPAFEEELSRQLQTLALDDSLALVEERSRSRLNLFRNPYRHFGRPDVRLLPSGPGTGSGSNSHTHSHQTGITGLGKSQTATASPTKVNDFPTFRICEVRPPSIEKFLEIDEGWWDLKAPALVLPGDTMPPLCTRNTLFSPEVFWALPLLPDYTAGDNAEELPEVPQNASRIPPWYIRGLWSQSLLGDLGGSIRLTLSRVPTLQLNQDFFVGGDYEPNVVGGNHMINSNRTGSSKLLKRWHCRSRSTFRCLLLMSKELSKSLYLGKTDLSLIEAWITDLKSIHYAEPPMLPKRRSHTNPCLGADGLHGVSFHPALEPKSQFISEEFVAARNDTLRSLVAKFTADESLRPRLTEPYQQQPSNPREKRETESPLELSLFLKPPEENSTFAPIDWSAHVSQVEPSDASPSDDKDGSIEIVHSHSASESEGHLEEDSYLVPIRGSSHTSTSSTESPSVFFYQPENPASDSSSSRRIVSVDEKPIFSPTAQLSGAASFSRTGKHFRSFLQQIAAKSAQEGVAADSFPILKAMADNMCPGFGPLVPYQPQFPQTDVLLIVVFTNQHYDLIPTLEVMYRSNFPNILYCGHPHESVEIFLRKYQTVEHRSFSFLPTYTKATYECVLGAIEMNYGVKGYMVVTDETLMKSWNVVNEDKDKVWVSTSGYDKVTRSSWQRLDPGGQKLPRLLEGISATWKLFSYILGGQDTYQYLDARGGRRRRSAEKETSGPEPGKVFETEKVSEPENLPEPEKLIKLSNPDTEAKHSGETLDTEETAYVDPNRANFRWGLGVASSNGSSIPENIDEIKNSTNVSDIFNETRSGDQEGNSDEKPANSAGDLQVSDWDYLKSSGLGVLDLGNITPDNETAVDANNSSGSDDNTTEEEVLVGEEEDENNPDANASMADIIGLGIIEDDNVSSSPSPIPPDDQVTDDATVPNIPAEELLENSTLIWPIITESSTATEPEAVTVSSTAAPESAALGVPIYHVEHAEPPTPPTWHKPDDLTSSSTPSSTTTTEEDLIVPETVLPIQSHEFVVSSSPSSSSVVPSESIEVIESSPSPSTPGHSSTTETKPTPESEVNLPSSTSASSPQMVDVVSSSSTQDPPTESELRNDMDALLDSLHETYANMLAIVGDYREHNNETSHSNEYSAEVFDPTHLEDSKSHRISPREFRHIRCTRVDDGHQSDLCSTLRQYINILSRNSGRDIRIIHDTVPMYYIPTSATKPFYSVANVLLHYGVMDELALPLLFRGLAPEADWVKLNRSTELKSPTESSTTNQYWFPFNLHKVYSDIAVNQQFCSKYLLRVFQM